MTSLLRGVAARVVPCMAALAVVGCGPSAIEGNPDGAIAADAAPVACRLPPGAVVGHHLRVLYLLPSDREAVPARIANLESAIRHVQHWFTARTPDGLSYLTHAPTVEVIELDNVASYYATNDNGINESLWFFNNVVQDAFEASSASFDDPINRWVLAIEADSDCEQIGRRTVQGVVVLPSSDLDVLAGAPRGDGCGESEELEPRCAQVGQIAYQLGRAFGLRRPPGCVDSDDSTPCDDSELMESGADAYPDATLAEANVNTLADSPFFRPLNPCPLACDRVVNAP